MKVAGNQVKYPRLKRFLSAFLLLVSFSVVTVEKSSASDCPESWNINIPTLEISKKTVVVDNISLDFYSSSLFGPDRPAFYIYGRGIQKIASGPEAGAYENRYALVELLPSVYSKLQELGKNAIWSSEYEILSSSTAEPVNQTGNPRLLFLSPEPVTNFLKNGIGEGSKIRWNLRISVKGCSDYIGSSNLFEIRGLFGNKTTLDSYFQSSKVTFNFRQQEKIRTTLDKNIKALQSASLGDSVLMERLGDTVLEGERFDYQLYGLSPTGCVVGVNPDSLFSVNPISVLITSLPCQVGIFAPLVIESRLIDSQSRVRDAYAAALVSTFDIEQKGLATPAPTPSVTSSSAPANTSTPSSKATPSAALSAKNKSAAKIKTWRCKKGSSRLTFKGKMITCPLGYKLTK